MPRRTSLVDDAIRQIGDSIRESAATGDRLPSEADISRQIGVSRPVVREALAFLRADGLVESRQGHGLFVTEQAVLQLRANDLRDSETGLRDLLEMRRALEAEAARLAAERRTPQDVEKLRRALLAMGAAEAEDKDGVEEDLEFHLAIASISRNPLLAKVMYFWTSALRDAIRFLRNADRSEPAILGSRQSWHERIFRHIEAGEAEAAHAAMMDHMNETIRRMEAQGSLRLPDAAPK